MFSLVKFLEDGVWSVARSNKIRRNRRGHMVAPFGRGHYEADIVLQHDNFELIHSFANNIKNNYPLVKLQNQCLKDSHFISPVASDSLSFNNSASTSIPNESTDSEYMPDSSCTFQNTMVLDLSPNSASTPHNATANGSKSEIFFSLPSKEVRTSASTNLVPTIDQGSKKDYCQYCHKLVTKIVRHLGTVHKNEDRVIEFLRLPKGSKQRRELTRCLKNEFNFEYNTQKKLYTGQLIVRRRPLSNQGKTEKDYVFCANCKGLYSKLNLRNHFRTCSESKLKGRRQSLVLGRRLRGSIHEKASDLLRDKVFPILREDDIICQIRFDELLIIYANNLCTKFASRPHCFALIRNKIRKMALFLHHIKQLDSTIENFCDVFHPRNFNNIIHVVNKMGKLNSNTGCLVTPSTAFDVGTQLKIMCEILKCEYIKKSDEIKLKEVQNTAVLLKQGLTTSVNVCVKEAMINQKRRKEIVLPSTKDIAKLMHYLYKNREKYFRLLNNKSFQIQSWIKLIEFTMLCIQTFNRRRPGETERMLIEDFERREAITERTNPELYNALSSEEKEMTQRYCRFQCRGKLVKNVAVLLNTEIEDSIKLILHYRRKAGVLQSNPYIFGQPHTSRSAFEHRFYRICPLLNKASIQCGAENPSTLRTIQLRKHVATQAAILHSKYGFKTTDLANFMGHDEYIHKNVYRIPDVAKQITGIGRLLEYIQGTESENVQSTTGTNLPSNKDARLEVQLNSSSNSSNNSEPEPVPKRNTRYSKNDENNYSESEESDYEPPKKRNRLSEDLGKEFIVRRSWSPSEKREAYSHFKKHIRQQRDPSCREIRHAKQVSPELTKRTEAQIRVWVRNQYQKLRKLSARFSKENKAK